MRVITYIELSRVQPYRALYAIQQTALYATEHLSPFLAHDTGQIMISSLWTYSTEELFGLTVAQIRAGFAKTPESVRGTLLNNLSTLLPSDPEYEFVLGVRDILLFIEQGIKLSPNKPESRHLNSAIESFSAALVMARRGVEIEYRANLYEIFFRSLKENS